MKRSTTLWWICPLLLLSSGFVALGCAGSQLAADDPVVPFSSAANARAGYDRAVTAYLAEKWADAWRLGMAVGASGGDLAPEGLILAARSAERAGDAPRAARLWAKAYQVGCSAAKPCLPQLPREDLFGLTATLGKLIPKLSQASCSSSIVNGTWYVTPGTDGPEIHEIPSRVLLEQLELPKDATAVCLSPDGHHRAAVVDRPFSIGKVEGIDRSYYVGARGEPWKGPLSTSAGTAPERTFVTNDGRVVTMDQLQLAVVAPGHEMDRDVPWPKGYHPNSARMGPPGVFFAALERNDDVTTTTPGKLVRVDLKTGALTVLLAEEDTFYRVGPADEQGRFVVWTGGSTLWMDGLTGKILGKQPSDFFGGPDGFQDGLTRDSALVTESNGFSLTDIVTGKSEEVTWVWHAPDPGVTGTPYDPAPILAVVRSLPLGTKGTFGDVPGWTVSQPFRESAHQRRQIQVNAPGQEPLRMVLTADQRGAMVVDASGHYELLGRVSPPFRASASCGPKGAANPPRPADTTWPLEVCAAALEKPGLTEAWFQQLRHRAAPASPSSSPSPR